MTTGLVVLAVAVVLALGFGLWRAASDGRFRGTHRVRGVEEPGAEAGPQSVLTGTAYDGQLGERATLLQFSSAFCAPCRATRRVLEDVAGIVPGVRHLEVDAEHHLELVRRARDPEDADHSGARPAGPRGESGVRRSHEAGGDRQPRAVGLGPRIDPRERPRRSSVLACRPRMTRRASPSW